MTGPIRDVQVAFRCGWRRSCVLSNIHTINILTFSTIVPFWNLFFSEWCFLVGAVASGCRVSLYSWRLFCRLPSLGFSETSCAFIPPQGQSPSRSVTPSSVETNEVIKYGDAWTGVPGHCVSTSFQPPCPPPQYSDNGHNHGASMIMFPVSILLFRLEGHLLNASEQNGTQHINYNTHWFSMLPHLYPIHPGHRFIAAPAVAGGTPFPDGCGPLPPPHSHHSYFEHTSISHPLNPYNGFHPPEYNGNYFPVQAYEPFNDYSFAFYPSQPQPIINDPEAAFQKMTRYPFENSNAFPSPRVYPLSPAILLMSPTANQPTQHQKMIPDSAVQLTPKKLPLDPRNKRTAHTTLHPTPENVLTGSNTRLARRANSHPRSPRSALLEEFRNSRDRKWDLKVQFNLCRLWNLCLFHSFC